MVICSYLRNFVRVNEQRCRPVTVEYENKVEKFIDNTEMEASWMTLYLNCILDSTIIQNYVIGTKKKYYF